MVDQKKLERIFTQDPELKGTYSRYRFALSEIKRLSENKDIHSDTVDDTRSYDMNIHIYEEKVNDCVWRMNWTANELGMENLFPFIV